jgi:hypothetical protein
MNARVTAAFTLFFAAAATAQPVTVNGVPDWMQPGLIGAPNGPGGGGNPNPGAANFRAWCGPSAASNLMGFWQDIGGFNVADGAAYVSAGVIAWQPPAPANWQDNAADASSIPLRGTGLARPVGADLGWYLDTNDQGDQIGAPFPLGNNGGGPAGEQFVGTKRVNMVPGIQNYLSARGFGQSTVTRTGGGAGNILAGWNNIVAEINAGRPLIGEFDHFNILPVGNPGGPEYAWGTPTSSDPQTGEEWDPGAGLGHATTIVGYIPGNALIPNQIIIQDNRRYLQANGLPEVDNVFVQMVLPFCTIGGQSASPWDANIALTVIPAPASIALLLLSGLAAAKRRR